MNILITALGSMSAEAVINSLKKIPKIKLIGCNLYPKTWTPASRLVDNFYQVCSAKDEDRYIQDIISICQNCEINYIIPLTDPEVDVLIKNLNKFQEKGITVCISSQNSIELARDKFKVYTKFLNDPVIKPIPCIKLTDEVCNSVEFPVILKPRLGRSSEGIQYAENLVELKFWQKKLIDCNYIVQPLLNGKIIVVDVVRQSNGEKCIAIAREELVRTSNGAGITVRTLPKHVCESLATNIASSIGMIGCFNVEFIVTNNEVFLMDINPRFSAGVIFSNMSGYNMVLNHLNCFIAKDIDTNVKTRIEKIYTRSFIEHEL